MAQPGVVHHFGPLPPVPAGPIASSLKSIVHEALGELPPGASGAAVTVTSAAGVNLVLAHRSDNGRWQADVWVGKSWGKEPWKFGASAKVLF